MGVAGDATKKLQVSLLGELRLASGGSALPLPASRKTRALFVYLLLCGRPVRRERLCEMFFDVPDDPRAALRWCLSKIRVMLCTHADRLLADRERVELLGDGIDTDVDALRKALGGSDIEAALPLAEWAMEQPLAGLDLAGCDAFNAWLAAERAELDGLRGRFLLALAQQPDLTHEQRSRFALEAEMLVPEGGAEPQSLAATPPVLEITGETADPTQQVRYTFAADGVRIAYACTGAGPPLVKAANWLNHLELDWSGPVWGRLFAELSRSRTLIRYDERGNGLSDWDVEDLSFDAFVRDLETVVDALGLDRFPLLGISQGSAVSIGYAARHPERVSHLILLGGYSAGWRHIASPEETEQREAVITLAQHGWGQDNPVYRQIFSQTFMPSATKEELDWFNEFQRRTATPNNAVAFLRTFSTIDVRHRLQHVRCPTLVLHARDDQRVPLYQGIELASAIPGASLVTLETDSHILLSREPATARVIECIDAFLSAAPPAGIVQRRQLMI